MSRITVDGGEGPRKQRASVTVACIGELRQLAKDGLRTLNGTATQMGIEKLTWFMSITELSCVFALVAGGGGGEVGGNVEKTSLSSAPIGFSMANMLFLVLKCTPNVGSHRYCLVSSSPHGLRVHCLDKAWICTPGEVAGLSVTVRLVVL